MKRKTRTKTESESPSPVKKKQKVTKKRENKASHKEDVKIEEIEDEIEVKEEINEVEELEDIEDIGLTFFLEKEIITIREGLINWYDENQRKLPWRVRGEEWKEKIENIGEKKEKEKNYSQRAYEVLVSEIMCQQTRYHFQKKLKKN